MKFTIALVATSEQVIINKMDRATQESSQAIVSIGEIEEENIHLLFFLADNPETQNILEKESKFYPCANGANYEITEESFNSMTVESAYELFIPIYSKWLLVNNVSLIEEMFPTASYLKDLWTNDRNSFFEELWFLLRSNLGTAQLRIIFNDLDQNENKDKLINSAVLGQKFPEIQPGGGAEKELMDNYLDSFSANFEIMEYNPEKGEMVASTSIDGSPILVIANLFVFNKLQKAILNSIFLGLQTEE